MKLRILSVASISCFVAIFLSTIIGCKEDTIIDANVVPVGDTANTYVVSDTLTILTKTVFVDSLATSLNISGVPVIQALGTISSMVPGDPYSGKTNASMYFQLIPPTLGFTFPQSPDSAVLILPYVGFTWGDTTATNISQTFKLYQLSDSLSKDSTYYSYTTKTVDRSQSIGEATIISYNPSTMHPSIKDSVKVNGVNKQPHLRVKIKPDFIEKIKNEAANGTSFAGYGSFLGFLKGLYIESDTSAGFGNALYYFRLDGTNDYNRANILFYYTEKNSNNQDTVKSTSFYFDATYAAHYNRIKRNYTGTPTGSIFATNAPSDSLIIIQNEPGAALDIKIPYLKNLFPDARPIIKAELIISQVTSDFTFLPFLDQYQKFTTPSRLYPVGINTDGTVYSIQDRYPTSSLEPLIFIDGVRNEVIENGKTISRYTLNIPREVQKAIVEKRDVLHLRVSGAVTFPGAYRLIGGGRNFSNSNLRMKLNIVYSKI